MRPSKKHEPVHYYAKDCVFVLEEIQPHFHRIVIIAPIKHGTLDVWLVRIAMIVIQLPGKVKFVFIFVVVVVYVAKQIDLSFPVIQVQALRCAAQGTKWNCLFCKCPMSRRL